MAVGLGFNGSLAWAGGNANTAVGAHNFQFTQGVAEHDVTTYLTTGDTSWVAGLSNCTATFDVYLDDAAALPAARVVSALTLTTASGRTITGAAFWTNRTIGVDVQGVATATYTVRFAGAVLFA